MTTTELAERLRSGPTDSATASIQSSKALAEMMPPPEWRLVEVRYAQKALNLSRSAVNRLMAAGVLRSVKVNGARRLLLSDVLAVIQSAA